MIIGQQDWDKLQAALAGNAKQLSLSPVYEQWKEELPAELIWQALKNGDLKVLQEPVYIMSRK